MDSLVANLFVRDMQRAINFYQSIGFSITMSVPETGDSFVWVNLKRGEVSIMLQTMESLGDELPEITRGGGGSLLLYIKMKNIQDFHDQLPENVRIIQPLNKTFYGATEFSIVDEDGFVLTFAEHEPNA